jgi:hypothetical protein
VVLPRPWSRGAANGLLATAPASVKETVREVPHCSLENFFFRFFTLPLRRITMS